MHPIQDGLAAQDFHITPQETEMEEVEVEVVEVEVEKVDHLQLQEEDTQTIEAMARS